MMLWNCVTTRHHGNDLTCQHMGTDFRLQGRIFDLQDGQRLMKQIENHYQSSWDMMSLHGTYYD